MPNDRDTMRQIHDLDTQVIDLLRIIQDFPDKKTTIEEKIKASQTRVDEALDVLHEKKKSADQVELDLNDKESQANSYETKLNAIKKNDEYKIMKEQIAKALEAASGLEDVLLGCMDQVEEAQSVLQTAQDAQKKQVTELQQTLTDLQESKDYAEDRLATYNGQKATLLDSLADMGLAEKYARLFERHQDQVAVNLTESGNCGGCFLKVTPDTISKVLSGKLVYCQSCERIFTGVDQ